ncbi:hypothetical protein HpCK38_15110 [Helicobacter pylori]
MKSEELVKLPLNEILQSLGYVEDLNKSTKRSIVMKNDNGDKIIINRASSGDYLYFNPHNEKDRGNIYSFCKNRGVDHRQILHIFKSGKEVKHSITPRNISEDDKNKKEKIQLFETFENLQEDNEVIKRRYLNFEELKFKDLKQDKQGNLCVKVWENKKANANGAEVIMPCGYSVKLRRPITHREGVKLNKPIKNLIYGDKGVEILLGKFEKLEEVKNIIISESVIDSLSFRELKDISPKECIIVGLGGNLKEGEMEVLQNLSHKFINADFHLAFDRDSEGRKFCEKVSLALAEIIPQEKINIAIPQLKDFNDDLQIIKRLKLSKTEQELEKKLKEEVKELEKRIKNSLSEYQKSKIEDICLEYKQKLGIDSEKATQRIIRR